MKAQAQQLQHDLAKIMRRFGRQCRGKGKGFVTLVRQTEKHLLEVGHQVLPLAQAAPECLHGGLAVGLQLDQPPGQPQLLRVVAGIALQARQQ